MWLGITLIVLPGLITILDDPSFYRWVFLMVLVSGGLIITFKNKPKEKEKEGTEE